MGWALKACQWRSICRLAQELSFFKQEHGPLSGSEQATTNVLLTTVLGPLRCLMHRTPRHAVAGGRSSASWRAPVVSTPSIPGGWRRPSGSTGARRPHPHACMWQTLLSFRGRELCAALESRRCRCRGARLELWSRWGGASSDSSHTAVQQQASLLLPRACRGAQRWETGYSPAATTTVTSGILVCHTVSTGMRRHGRRPRPPWRGRAGNGSAVVGRTAAAARMRSGRRLRDLPWPRPSPWPSWPTAAAVPWLSPRL